MKMPQELNVLRCYACKMFQVHIVKKSKKWLCKICNAKQSIQSIYFRGSGAECRKYVQTRNIDSGTCNDDEEFYPTVIEAWGLDCEANDDNELVDPCECNQKKLYGDKWSKYLTNAENTSPEKENFLSQQSPKRGKFENNGKQTRSLPATQNSLTGTRNNLRSQSVPKFGEGSNNVSGKWCKFLEENSEDLCDTPEEIEEGEKFLFTSVTSSESSTSNGNDFSYDQDSEKSSKDGNVEDYRSFANKDFNPIKRRRNEPGNDEVKKVCPSGENQCSQVDTSSDSSKTAFHDIDTNVFDDLNDDLDLTIDF